MEGFSLRRLTFMFFVAFLVWSSSLETCIARKGKHWQRSHAAVSLYKKKTKGHAHGQAHRNYHNGGSKPKSPPRKTTPPSPKQPLPPPQKGYGNGQPSKVFDVLHFGAKGDGKTDDTKAFQAAWAAACKVEASTVVVPAEYIFLVGPISFSGPYCQANIVFQLDGMIIAPTDSRPWGEGILQWLEFTKLKGITVEGKGVIDGRGSGWWQDAPYEDPYDDERKFIIPLNTTVHETPPMPVRNELSGKMPNIKPTALRFYGSFNVTVTGITIRNSPQCHLKFDNCIGVVVHDMSISSPGDSPNTDGIHLQNSKDVLIHGTDLACGN
ncbi:hypothetical protein V6N13_101579 [Hibiscus sabdariffa]